MKTVRQPHRRGGSGSAPAPSRRGGFTLMECLIASAILAFSVAAISQAIVAGQEQSFQAAHQARAMELAQAMLEEILAVDYRDPEGGTSPGKDAGESGRTQFDNADDFHGYTENFGQVRDAAGVLYAGAYQEFRRDVSAAYQTVNVANLGSIPGLLVTITVRDRHNQQWVLTRFIPEPDPELQT